MRGLHLALERLRALRRPHADADLEDELAAYLEALRARHHEVRGLRAAMRCARRASIRR